MTTEIAISEQHYTLIENNHLGVLSTIRAKDGMISTNPVGYYWDGEYIRISTLKSRVKYRNLEANSTVAFCIIDAKDTTRYIEIRGWATLDDDVDNQFMRRQFKWGTGIEPPADLDPPGAQRAIITIHPMQVSSPVLYGGRFSRK